MAFRGDPFKGLSSTAVSQQDKWRKTLLNRNEELVRELYRVKEENSLLKRMIRHDIANQLGFTCPEKSIDESLLPDAHIDHMHEPQSNTSSAPKSNMSVAAASYDSAHVERLLVSQPHGQNRGQTPHGTVSSAAMTSQRLHTVSNMRSHHGLHKSSKHSVGACSSNSSRYNPSLNHTAKIVVGVGAPAVEVSANQSSVGGGEILKMRRSHSDTDLGRHNSSHVDVGVGVDDSASDASTDSRIMGAAAGLFTPSCREDPDQSSCNFSLSSTPYSSGCGGSGSGSAVKGGGSMVARSDPAPNPIAYMDDSDSFTDDDSSTSTPQISSPRYASRSVAAAAAAAAPAAAITAVTAVTAVDVGSSVTDRKRNHRRSRRQTVDLADTPPDNSSNSNNNSNNNQTDGSNVGGSNSDDDWSRVDVRAETTASAIAETGGTCGEASLRTLPLSLSPIELFRHSYVRAHAHPGSGSTVNMVNRSKCSTPTEVGKDGGHGNAVRGASYEEQLSANLTSIYLAESPSPEQQQQQQRFKAEDDWNWDSPSPAPKQNHSSSCSNNTNNNNSSYSSVTRKLHLAHTPDPFASSANTNTTAPGDLTPAAAATVVVNKDGSVGGSIIMLQLPLPSREKEEEIADTKMYKSRSKSKTKPATATATATATITATTRRKDKEPPQKHSRSGDMVAADTAVPVAINPTGINSSRHTLPSLASSVSSSSPPSPGQSVAATAITAVPLLVTPTINSKQLQQQKKKTLAVSSSSTTAATATNFATTADNAVKITPPPPAVLRPSRRAAAMANVNYAEPSLAVKVRKGHQFFPKTPAANVVAVDAVTSASVAAAAATVTAAGGGGRGGKEKENGYISSSSSSSGHDSYGAGTNVFVSVAPHTTSSTTSSNSTTASSASSIWVR